MKTVMKTRPVDPAQSIIQWNLQKDDLTMWQECGMWCHEKCAGTISKKLFICGKC